MIFHYQFNIQRMFENPVSNKSMLFIMLFSLVLIGMSLLRIFVTGNDTIVVFCDVGQGDGAYIRTSEGVDIVIDAGFDKQMLMCLGKYMPFYDRNIEWAFLSHADKDHYGGFQEIVKRYSIDQFALPEVLADDEFQMLIKQIKAKNIPIHFIKSPDVIHTSTTTKIDFFWPTQSFISSESILSKGIKVPRSGDQNEFSFVHTFSQYGTDILFTGDAMPNVLEVLMKNIKEEYQKGARFPLTENIEILKVPHHGSKNGLIAGFLTTINPYVSVISVGKKNSFGHPSKEIKDMFQDSKRTVMATSISGDVVVRINKEGWNIETPLESAF